MFFTKTPQLWVYPIKSLRGVRLDEAELTPQGIRYDRRFMICKFGGDGQLQKVQLDKHAECGLFSQAIVDDAVHVRYLGPKDGKPIVPEHALQKTTLEVPLEPDVAALDRAEMNLHQSMVSAYRMGAEYDEWFTACFGFDAALLFIGDQRRPVLGTFSPNPPPTAQNGWLSTLSSYITGGGAGRDPDWLTFSDCAPYLLATEASLANVRERFSESVGMDIEVVRFRPNIVFDGDEQWAEDFWGELAIGGDPVFTLSKMCNRCASLNVDYDTGRHGVGERGTVLKKLMSDRRVDTGAKYSPVFGRYGFLSQGTDGLALSVGDEVSVTKTVAERPVWDWPLRDPSVARYYSKT